MSKKRTLKTLSINEKFKLIKEVESGTRKKDVATKFGIPANTVSTILKNKQTIITAIENGAASGTCKRLKKPTYKDVDSEVLEWFKSALIQNLPITGKLIKEKAKDISERLEITNFKASTGWLDNWKRRSGICFETVQLGHGDSDSDDILEEELQQPPSNELVEISLSVLHSYLKHNKNTTDYLYKNLEELETFFEIQSINQDKSCQN